MNYASTSDDFIDGAELLPYPELATTRRTRPEDGNAPVSIGLTEFHVLMLYRDRLSAICNLNDKLVFDQTLPLVRPFLWPR